MMRTGRYEAMSCSRYTVSAVTTDAGTAPGQKRHASPLTFPPTSLPPVPAGCRPLTQTPAKNVASSNTHSASESRHTHQRDENNASR